MHSQRNGRFPLGPTSSGGMRRSVSLQDASVKAARGAAGGTRGSRMARILQQDPSHRAPRNTGWTSSGFPHRTSQAPPVIEEDSDNGGTTQANAQSPAEALVVSGLTSSSLQHHQQELEQAQAQAKAQERDHHQHRQHTGRAWQKPSSTVDGNVNGNVNDSGATTLDAGAYGTTANYQSNADSNNYSNNPANSERKDKRRRRQGKRKTASLRQQQERSRIYDGPAVDASYNSVPLIEIDRLPRGGISLETKAVGRIQVCLYKHPMCSISFLLYHSRQTSHTTPMSLSLVHCAFRVPLMTRASVRNPTRDCQGQHESRVSSPVRVYRPGRTVLQRNGPRPRNQSRRV